MTVDLDATQNDAPWSALTDVDRVVGIHRRGLEEHGGAEGPARPEPCVDGALGAAYNAELYLEGRRHLKTGLPFAAFSLVYLALRHCFVDGNKRVAWASATDILAGLGLGVTAEEQDVIDMIESVIRGELDGADVSEWLASRLYAL